MKKVSILRVGIASYDEIKKRTLAIAQGKLKPAKNAPKVWFSSIESMAQVLSTRNTMLLAIIEKTKPDSVTELAELSGRQKSNLSRTLKTLEQYGIVKLDHDEGTKIRPRVLFNHFEVDFDLRKQA
jgi:predicted transcriptional regulator